MFIGDGGAEGGGGEDLDAGAAAAEFHNEILVGDEEDAENGTAVGKGLFQLLGRVDGQVPEIARLLRLNSLIH